MTRRRLRSLLWKKLERLLRLVAGAQYCRILHANEILQRSNHFDIIPITLNHAGRVARLPFHYRDPFDRLIIVQAIEEGASDQCRSDLRCL